MIIRVISVYLVLSAVVALDLLEEIEVYNKGKAEEQAVHCELFDKKPVVHCSRLVDNSTCTSVHFFLTADFGCPSFVIFEASPLSQVEVFCKNNTNDDCIRLSNHSLPFGAVGTAFTKLVVFDDTEDKANVALATEEYEIPLNELDWELPEWSNGSEPVITFKTTNSSQNYGFLGNGTLEISVTIYSSRGRSEMIPKLLHSQNSIQVDLVMNHVYTTNYTNPRLALEVFALSNQNLTRKNESMVDDKSIDDEFTPGIFERFAVLFPEKLGYVAWKPVCYRDAERQRSLLTQARPDPLHKALDFPEGLIPSLFGNLSDIPIARAFNITFGYPKDKFYSKTSYAVWTMCAGLGVLPETKFSTLILVILVCCFALPAVAILVGVTIALYARFRKSKRVDDVTALLENEEEPAIIDNLIT